MSFLVGNASKISTRIIAAEEVSRTSSGREAFIPEGSVINGTVEVAGSVDFNGSIKGDIICTGDVLVGDNASVNGCIKCVDIDIRGKVVGNIDASAVAKLHSTASVTGDINAGCFEVEHGASFKGNVEVGGICDTSSSGDLTAIEGKK